LKTLLNSPHLDYDNGRENLIASGELYWDDGDSIINDINLHNYYHFEFEFFASRDKAYLKITRLREAENLPLPTLDNIEIFGYEFIPNADTMKLDGIEINATIDKLRKSNETLEMELEINEELGLETLDSEDHSMNITSTHLIDLNKNGPVWMLTWNNL
jgi:hypothetical protein